MKKHVLVALSDANNIQQVKQVFASAHLRGGWDGDYLLLAFEVPALELNWFRSHGVYVQEFEPFFSKAEWASRTTAKPDWFRQSRTRLGKLQLFTTAFKRWDIIVYLDTDTIVVGPLQQLTRVSYFAACLDLPYHDSLEDQFARPDWVARKLGRRYNLRKPSFNSGVIAFRSALIDTNTFSALRQLLEEYLDVCHYVDQPVLNLFFYNRWERLPCVYNCPPALLDAIAPKAAQPSQLNGMRVLHFYGDNEGKPWNAASRFHPLWWAHFKQADQLDLRKPPRISRSRPIRTLLGQWRFSLLAEAFLRLFLIKGHLLKLLQRRAPFFYNQMRGVYHRFRTHL